MIKNSTNLHPEIHFYKDFFFNFFGIITSFFLIDEQEKEIERRISDPEQDPILTQFQIELHKSKNDIHSVHDANELIELDYRV